MADSVLHDASTNIIKRVWDAGMVTTCTKPGGWHHARLAAGAVLLTLALAASPSGAADCDGYIGGEDDASAFWSTVSQDDLRACIEAHGVDVRDKEYGGTPLHWAAVHTHNSDVIVALFGAGADIEATIVEEMTPLHLAVRNDNEEAIGALLELGADFRVKTGFGYTPLHLAAMYQGGPVGMTLLLEAGADPTARDDEFQRTPLHYVSYFSSDPRLVEALVDAGGDLSARDASGLTPLHAAGLARNLSMIEALLEAGADPNARTDVGESPLHLAVTSHPDTMAPDVSMLPILEELEERQKLVDNPEIAEVLLAAGADPSARDAKGISVLHLAALYTTDPAITVMLLKAGSDIEADDHKGHTPLHLAAAYNVNPAIIHVLIDAGAHVGARAMNKVTALHMAAAYNANPDIIDVLIDAGADPNAREQYGMTPLHAAVSSTKGRNPATIAALLKAGADPNARDRFGMTPMHYAMLKLMSGDDTAEIALLLLDAGADPGLADREGKTPWYYVRKQWDLAGTELYERLRILAAE